MQNVSKDTKIEMKSINDQTNIYMVMDENLNFSYLNEVLPRLLGFSEEILSGSSFIDYSHPNISDKLFSDMKKSLEEKQKWDGLLQLIVKDSGETVWLDVYFIKSVNGNSYTGTGKVPSDEVLIDMKETLYKKYSNLD